jgi:phosphoenolpyruvate carboxylase
MISNIQMALFKTDTITGKEYSMLAQDQVTALSIYQTIADECHCTIDQVLSISGNSSLMSDTPDIALSLHRRNPYLDPLNHVQIVLLKRYRDPNATDAERDEWIKPLLRSINAIAAGMRNTG